MLIINLNINPGLRAEKTIVLMLYEYLFVLWSTLCGKICLGVVFHSDPWYDTQDLAEHRTSKSVFLLVAANICLEMQTWRDAV